MAGRKRAKKYSRRASRMRRSSKKWVIPMAIVAFLALCFTVSVIIGLALGRRAEEYQPAPSYDLEVKDYYSGDKRVKTVDAHSYKWGFGTGQYFSDGITDLSVCLRDSDGYITYDSEVNVSFGEESEGSRRLSDEVRAIHDEGGYICGYIYVHSFKIEDEHLRSVYKAYEAALVAEAVRGGVDEIMLVGLAPDDDNIGEVENFVSDMARAAADKPLGVLLSREIFSATAENDYRAARIRKACDFVAVDLTDLPKNADFGREESVLYKTLGEMEYYIKSYSARVVISAENSALYKSLREFGAENIQIIE